MAPLAAWHTTGTLMGTTGACTHLCTIVARACVLAQEIKELPLRALWPSVDESWAYKNAATQRPHLSA